MEHDRQGLACRADGKNHYYSKQAPLLTTLFAGVYQALHTFTGAKLTEDPFFVARWILVIVNAIPLGLFWWWCSRWCRDEIRGLWGSDGHALVYGLGDVYDVVCQYLKQSSFGGSRSRSKSLGVALPGKERAIPWGMDLSCWTCLRSRSDL